MKRTVLEAYAVAQQHIRQLGGFHHAERVYSSPLDSDALLLPREMKVHNVEWVADGAAQFIQKQGSPLLPPFFLYIGWTLPHGPDAGSGVNKDAVQFTPGGMWKQKDAAVTATTNTRAEVRKVSDTTAIIADRTRR